MRTAFDVGDKVFGVTLEQTDDVNSSVTIQPRVCDMNVSKIHL